MKIAIFSDCYLDLTGGIKSSIDAQKTELEKRGHEVVVFSTGFFRSHQQLGQLAAQNIYMVPSCKLFFYKLTPVSRRPAVIEKWLLREHPEIKDFDVFYVHYEAGCSIAALRLAKRLKIPAVQVMHGREDMGEVNIIPRGLRSFVAWGLNWLHSWYLPHSVKVHRDNYLAPSFARARMWTMMVNHANYADLVLTPSQHFADKLKHYGVTRPIKVMPNGVPDDKYDFVPEVKELLPGREFRIIWHSRVSAEKHMMPFLRALQLVQGKYRMDVYGGGGDFFRARRFAKRHKMNVDFHGNMDFRTVREQISKSHLDVLVSYDFDTFGMTLIEAEAAGVPVFFCDPDMQEVVPHGSYVMSAGPSAVEMAAALDELIAEPERVRKMSEIMLKHRDEVMISRRIEILEKYFSGIIKT